MKPITKFYDTKSKKITVFPDIGAFEVSYENKLLFSKKKTNAWPDFRDVREKIIKRIEEKYLKTQNASHQVPNSNIRYDSHEETNRNPFRDSDYTDR